MPNWGRYAVTVYVGLLMAGALGRPPLAARSASCHDGGSGLSAKVAPLKAPYVYPGKAELQPVSTPVPIRPTDPPGTSPR